jgi:DNA-binding PadR family transcriptional regulator
MSNEAGNYLPLSPAVLHILISLAGEDRHGYGIMQEVALQSDGQYKLGPGTLYDNLQRLLDQGLVTEINRKGEEDSRRRYYRLTSLGKRVVNAEIGRLEGVFRQAKVHLRPTKVAKA